MSDVKTPAATHEARIRRLIENMAAENLDGYLVLAEENRRYLSGFTGEDHQFDESAGALIISENTRALATDGRFEIQAKNESPDFEVRIYKKGLARVLPDIVKEASLRRIGFEERRLSVKQHHDLASAFAEEKLSAKLIQSGDLVADLRIRKDPAEIEKTKSALLLAETVWMDFIQTIRPGMTEKTAAWELEKRLREAGADALSFPSIVAGGPNAALPHAVCSDRPFQKGEPVLFDWGVKLDEYCSDISRTVVIGPPDERFVQVYETVRTAQQKGIAAIAPGIGGKAVDAAARSHIDQAGFKEHFGHGLGHGTGLAVHERPRLGPLSKDTLARGMIVTVEPGIYIEGWGGVRIENQVAVGASGPEALNTLSTELLVL